MSRIWGKLSALITSKTFKGMDKAGNRYFIKNEEIDGFMKEKRMVIFKKESEPTSIPVEWISWLNGQRKEAPTPEEEALYEARREQVRENVARLKKEEEERKLKLKESSTHKPISSAKVAGPNLNSFIQQLSIDSEGNKTSEESKSVPGLRETTTTEAEKEEKTSFRIKEQPQSSEPTGSGGSYKPGTWQPPT